MHGDHRPGLRRERARATASGSIEQGVVGHVDEDRPGAHPERREGRGHEGERRHDHLVARAHPQGAQRELQRVAAVRHAHAVRGAAVAGEGRLEVRDGGAEDVGGVVEHPAHGRQDVVAQRGVLGFQVEERNGHGGPPVGFARSSHKPARLASRGWGRESRAGRTGDSLTSPVIRASGAGTEEIFTEDREDRKGRNEIEFNQDRIYRINRMNGLLRKPILSIL
jgi:hypothetical protein